MDLIQGIALATTASATVLLVRILLVRQATRFAALTFYLAHHLIWGISLILVPRTGPWYALLYKISTPVEWVAATWCVAHLLGKGFAAYPGIRTMSRWATWGASLIAVCFALLLVGYFWQGDYLGRRTLLYLEVADRSVLLSLALVIILTVIFFSRYPFRLQSNTWTSLIAFSAIVLSMAVARLFDSLAPAMAAFPADLTQLGFEAGCYLVWAGNFRREEAQGPPHVIITYAGEHELLRQLQAMDGILHRVGRG